MFTGIVTDIGEITSLTPTAQGQLHRLRIACRYDRATIADGASIACNGVCLTVVDKGAGWFAIDVSGEIDLRCDDERYGERSVFSLIMQRMRGSPSIVSILMRAGTVGSDSQRRQVRALADFIIEPPMVDISIRDPFADDGADRLDIVGDDLARRKPVAGSGKAIGQRRA